MEWHPIFKVGRMRLQLSFTGGHLCGGATTAACYETSDPVVQKVIEDSEAFRNGRILLASMESRDSSSRLPKPSVFEYSDLEEVYDYLEQKKGVTLEELNADEDACFRVAKRLGIILKKKTD